MLLPTLLSCGDGDVEGGSLGHEGAVLVEDGPLPGHGLVPHANVVGVNVAVRGAATRGRSGQYDGVGVAVDARDAYVGVVVATVGVGGSVDERDRLRRSVGFRALRSVGRFCPRVLGFATLEPPATMR